MADSKFVWYELRTSDLDAASRFYGRVVGWAAADFPGPGPRYVIVSAEGRGVAGMMVLPEEARARGAKDGWVGYVAVDDVDAYAGKVTAAGGRVFHGPDDIPEVGRFAVVADPQGAAFILFKPSSGENPAPLAPGTPGTFGWRELVTSDREAAVAFYTKLFAWTRMDAIDMGEIGIYQIFGIDGTMAGGMMTKPANCPAPFWGYYINVENTNAAIDRATGAGGSLMNGPHQVPGGSWIAHLHDPQGVAFAVVGPA